MKTFEKLVKQELLKQVEDWFAYRAGRGVNTYIVKFPLSTSGILKMPHARLLFIDFSSAFNAIQPYLLAEKLQSLFNLIPNLIVWNDAGFSVEQVAVCQG